MTNFHDKPKRKHKPKHMTRRRWIVLLILLMLAILSQIMVSVVHETVTQAITSSESCNMDVDYPFLHYEEDNYLLYIGNLNSQLITSINQHVSDVRWFHDGKAFIYRKIHGNNTSSIKWYDLTTTIQHESELSQDRDSYGFRVSPQGNYIALLEPGSYKLEKEIIILDANTETIVSKHSVHGEFHSWFADGDFVLSHMYGTIFTDYVIDIQNNRVVYLELPTGAIEFKTWLDDTKLVYTTNGDFVEFDLSTDPPIRTISKTYVIEIGDFAIEATEINRIENGRRLLIVDKNYQYWLVDLINQSYSIRPEIDHYQQHYFNIPNSVVTPDDYDAPVSGIYEFDVTELMQGRKLRLTHFDMHSHSVSKSGDFILMRENIGNDSRGTVQSFDTSLKTTIGFAYVWQWLTINDHDYLYFSQSVVDTPNAYTHYLYNPETQSACVVMVSQARKLIWQPR